MGHFQMECDKWHMTASNPNHWYSDIQNVHYYMHINYNEGSMNS